MVRFLALIEVELS